MGSRALGAMFGGLEDFIKLRRGLQQNTEDRAMQQARHDLAMRQGSAQAGLTEGELAEQPKAFKRADVGFAHTIAGAPGAMAALGDAQDPVTEALKQALVLKSGDEQVARDVNKTNLGIMGNTLTMGNQTVDARKAITGNPNFDATQNRADANTAVVAGLEGLNNPTFKASSDFTKERDKSVFSNQQTLQNSAHQNQRALQNDAQQFQETMANRGIPEGLDPATGAMLDGTLKNFEGSVDQVSREIALIQREIAENTTRLAPLKGTNMPGQLNPQAATFEAAIKANEQEKQARIAAVRQQAQQIQQMVSGLNIKNPQTLRVLEARLNAALTTIDRVSTTPAVESAVPAKKPAL